MKIHLFDSWHLPHIPHLAHSRDEVRDEEFDILTLLVFSVGVPLLILGGLSVLEVLFDGTLM